MAGLESVTSGQIVISGKHVEKMTESELILFRQNNIGFVFQSFNLITSMTALENTALPLAFRGMGKRSREKKAMDMLKAVGIGTTTTTSLPSCLAASSSASALPGRWC